MTCEVDGCDRLDVKIGMCGMHYQRYRKYGDANFVLRQKYLEPAKCKAEDCKDKTTYSIGYCSKHYLRYTRYGREHNIVNRGSGYSVHAKGYIYIYVDGKQISEHRFLAEKALGRPLPEGTIVHHTNKPWDNHGYCKLVICPDQEYHKLIHQRMKELGYENN